MSDPPHHPDLRQRLNDSLVGATPAGASVAAHFLNHLDALPFETAASVARRIGVSEATVGRYCRAIGYPHFKGLKAALQRELGDRAWRTGQHLRTRVDQDGAMHAPSDAALQSELAAIVANHQLAATPEFARAAQRIAHSPLVFVAGFQTERGHARYLADMLQYLRPGVQMVDLADGAFADPLLAAPGQACLILFDSRRYSRITRQLAEAAQTASVPVTMITDPWCDWAPGLASEVLTVQVDLGQFWDATSAFASLACLLVNAVFHELGPTVETRMTKVSDLHDRFVGHTRALRRAPR
jgi:DNA-binding MurR/RpiR family transcriptional regulator